MDDILELARVIIAPLNDENLIDGKDYDELVEALITGIQRTRVVSDLLKVIALDTPHWTLPLELVVVIYQRAVDLDADSDEVVKWYASRLLFYGEQSDEKRARELLLSRNLSLK